MDLMTVNDDANFIAQIFVNDKWQTFTEEYSASSASILISNVHQLTGCNTRFLSKRSKNKVIGECVSELKPNKGQTDAARLFLKSDPTIRPDLNGIVRTSFVNLILLLNEFAEQQSKNVD